MLHPLSSRRRFLKASAVALAAPFILPARVWFAPTPPNSQLAIGIIGTGLMSRGLIRSLQRHHDVRIVAICDVDATRLANIKQRVDDHAAEGAPKNGGNGCAAYSDFRELLDRPDIDGVIVATPDHWHAIISILAMRAGKDVYCEKPLCQSVNEALALVQATRKHQRVFQTGSQQRSNQRFRHACELVRNGRVGKLHRVEVALPPGIATWCDLPESEPPEGLDWEKWQGPARARGWNEILSPTGVHSHFPRWRLYREYGGGMITDWGAHHFDIAQWGMGTDDSGPIEVIPPEEEEASGVRLLYENGVEVVHQEGNGVTFHGSEGHLFISRHEFRLEPEALAEEPLPDDAIQLYRSEDHVRDWLDCMRSRKKPICDVEIGARSVIVCHLTNMAYWNGKRFSWDPIRNAFAGGTGERDWLGVSYRAPWTLPEA